jgi:spore maturation protein CgeB
MIRILYVTRFQPNSTNRMRAESMRQLGLDVIEGHVGELPRLSERFGRLRRGVTRLLGYPQVRWQAARTVVEAARKTRPDVIWCDKALFLPGSALDAARRCGEPLVIHYNPDDPFVVTRVNWDIFRRAIPAYDVHLVPRQPNVAEYLAHGARHVLTFDRGYSPTAHVPPDPHDPRWSTFATDVAFTGTFEAERAASISMLARHGIPVAVRGDAGWESPALFPPSATCYRGGAVFDAEYRLALGAPKITLHFLRHANRDEQDSRTFEIPACGGFMLAEWSPRHAELFEEDREAVFFRDDEELLRKVRYYLDHPDERRVIAERGRRRCLESGYDYESRLHDLLTRAFAVAGRQDLLDRMPPAPGTSRPRRAAC